MSAEARARIADCHRARNSESKKAGLDMVAAKNSKRPMGEHWKKTGYPAPYQLCRRVEAVANQLSKRQKAGHAPLVAHIRELDAIAIELKTLHPPPAKFQTSVK